MEFHKAAVYARLYYYLCIPKNAAALECASKLVHESDGVLHCEKKVEPVKNMY